MRPDFQPPKYSNFWLPICRSGWNIIWQKAAQATQGCGMHLRAFALFIIEMVTWTREEK
jgi:hypothetical protein